MAYAKKPSVRKPSMPKPSMGASGVTSSVRNVSNTGQMSTSTQTTGATGAVRNSTVISNSGTPGAAGAQSASVQSISPNVTWDGGTNFQINPSMGNAMTMPAPTSDVVRGAYTQVEGELARARSTALGMVPAEYRDRVNEHFDRASTQLSEHKKKMGY